MAQLPLTGERRAEFEALVDKALQRLHMPWLIFATACREPGAEN